MTNTGEFGGNPYSDVSRPALPSSASGGNTDHPSFLNRCGEVFASAREDYRQSNHKAKMLGVAGLVGVLQTLDRARTSVVLVPAIAANVYQYTDSPAAAAVAATAACMGWCVSVGGVTAEGLQQYPQAVEKFGNNFPGVVNFFNDSLPGAEMTKPEKGMSRVAKARHLGKNLVTRIRRGYTVVGIGSVAYASNAVANGKSRKEVQMLNANASLDGSLAVGAAVGAVAETVATIGQAHPELAERIQQDAANPYVWYGLAGFMLVGQFIANRVHPKSQQSLASGGQS